MKDGIQITSIEEFNEIVGTMRYQDFGGLGIRPRGLLGDFTGEDYGKVVAFCEQRRECHVISYVEGSLFNRAIPGQKLYLVGRGSADPRYFYVTPPYVFKMMGEFLSEVAGRGTQNQTQTLGERLDNIFRKYGSEPSSGGNGT